MTDDKGAGEGPYRKITHYTKFETGDSRIDAYGDGVAELDVTNSDGWGILRLINSAHFEGRKAERDKNWKTVAELCGVNPHTHRPCIEKVEEKFRCPICVCAGKIRGGQDGE